MNGNAAIAAALCVVLAFGCTASEVKEPPVDLPESMDPGGKEALDPVPGEKAPPPVPGEGAMIPGNLEELLETPTGKRTYRLQPGDIIHVSVYDHPDLTTRLRVPEQGSARFPLIGDLELLNRPHDEIEAEVRRRLEKDFVALAPVSVMLEKVHEDTAYLLGRVARQGEYRFRQNRPLSLLQLVAKAGGFLDDADTEHLRLIRGSGPDRRFWILSVKEIEKAGRIGLDVTLKDGDTIMVPILPRVYILGCVNKPGAIGVPAGTRLTLARVVSQSGGFSIGANREEIFVVRYEADGKSRTIPVRFKASAGGEEAQGNFEILPGDTILVRSAARIYVLGAVTRPGGFLPSEEDLTATKAISLAGGFTRRADSNGTVVIRSTASGQKVIRVRVRSIVSSESEKQVRLRPGDIVFVPERFF